MKLIFGLSLLVLLFGCINLQNKSTDLTCGGIAGRTCPNGYVCKIQNDQISDAAGTCILSNEASQTNNSNNWNIAKNATTRYAAANQILPYFKNLPSKPLDRDIRFLLERGCKNTTHDWILDCSNTDLSQQFNCDESPENSGLMQMGYALELNASFLRCRSRIRPGQEDLDYFYCSGGLTQFCYSYVLANDTDSVQIKNEKELAAKITPLETESEALAFLLLSRNVMSEFKFDYENSEVKVISNVTRKGNNFLITAYQINVFGCRDSDNLDEITFEVSRNGSIEELERETIFSKSLSGRVCVD